MRQTDSNVITEIILQRKGGATVPELARQFNLGKATVWRYVSTIPLSSRVKKQIQSRRGGSKIRRRERIESAAKEAQEILQRSFDIKVAPLILSALYWAEGTKGAFVFTNTDPEMIRIVVQILKNNFNIGKDRLQVLVRVHKASHAVKNRNYWARILDLPSSKVKVNINSLHNKTSAPHGLCRLTISKGAQLLKVIRALNIELTHRILSDYNANLRSRSSMDRALHS